MNAIGGPLMIGQAQTTVPAPTPAAIAAANQAASDALAAWKQADVIARGAAAALAAGDPNDAYNVRNANATQDEAFRRRAIYEFARDRALQLRSAYAARSRTPDEAYAQWQDALRAGRPAAIVEALHQQYLNILRGGPAVPSNVPTGTTAPPNMPTGEPGERPKTSLRELGVAALILSPAVLALLLLKLPKRRGRRRA